MADPRNLESAVARDPMREALRQSEEHFRELVSGVEDYAIFLLSPDGRVATWNSGAHRIKGYSAEEIIGHHFSRFYPPEAIAEGVPERELGIAREQGRFAEEAWRLRKDGSRFWASVAISPLTGEDGTLRGFLKITRDLSERRVAEELLRQSEEKFRLLVEGVQEYAIFMLSPEGNVASWSQAAERIKGWQASEILGRHFSCFYPPEAVAAGKPAWELQVALEKGFVEDQGPRLRKDGQQFWANVVITALRDAEGRHIGFAKVTRDLTVRRREEEMTRRVAELRLLESEERFARFAEHLPGLAWIKDLEGRYVYVNDAATRAFRVPREEIYGRTDEDLFPPDVAAEFRANDRKALSGAGIEVVERLGHHEGQERHSIVSKFPIFDAEDRLHLLGGIAIDITERVQAEDALRLADRRKDEFLATLAHELRNPLAPIRNALHILRKSGGGERQSDRIHEMLEHQLTRMVRLVDDLLEVSRITGGKVELRKEPVDLSVVILSAIETSRPLIEEASHDLEVTLPPDPIVLDADPVRLGQVISNLLNNAAKYTQERGHLWLTADREGAEAVISVRDDGLGIPPDMLPRVFDMFAQVDRTLKRAQGGLGIGLALAQSLVELHGGRVEAKSEGLDQGSEFVVRLPITTSRREAPAESKSGGKPAMSIPPGRILVVDDSRDGADSLGMVLKMMGADPEVVYDGPAALEAVHASHPEVVLLDIGMPGMDGYEVAARIRADPAFNDVRLVALTGWGSEEERRRSREAGFDDHWVKPVDPAKLRELLARNPG